MVDVILSSRLELLMFFAGAFGYLTMLCSKWVVYKKNEQLNAEHVPDLSEAPTNNLHGTSSGEDDLDVHASLEVSCNNGDHAAVLRCWDVIKRLAKGPTIPLSQIVASMRFYEKDTKFIANELRIFFEKHPNQCDASTLNSIFDRLGEETGSELMELILDMLPFTDLKRDERAYEIMLKMRVATRDYSEIQDLVTHMHTNKVELTARAMFFVMKGALQAHDFDTAFDYFKKLKLAWKARSTSEPLVPHSIMMLLVELAWENQEQFGQLVRELSGMPLPEKTIDTMLVKCVESHDADRARSVESIARAERATLPDSTYSLLIKAAMTSTPLEAHGLVKEVLAREGSGFSPDLVSSVLDFCAATSDTAIVDQLVERVKPRPVNILGAFIWFYIYAEEFEKACDVYELDMQPACTCADGSVTLDASLQESIVDAAVLCGRTHLAERLVAGSRSATTGHLGIIWRGTSHIKQLIDSAIVVLAACNAVVSYWVVLVF